MHHMIATKVSLDHLMINSLWMRNMRSHFSIDTSCIINEVSIPCRRNLWIKHHCELIWEHLYDALHEILLGDGILALDDLLQQVGEDTLHTHTHRWLTTAWLDCLTFWYTAASMASSWERRTRLVPTRILSSRRSFSLLSLSLVWPWCCMRTHSLFISAKFCRMNWMESSTLPSLPLQAKGLKQIPSLVLTHSPRCREAGFCCTGAGSFWGTGLSADAAHLCTSPPGLSRCLCESLRWTWCTPSQLSLAGTCSHNEPP